MKRLSIMLKPASSLCNMRCTYCFYANVSASRKDASHGLMSQDTATAIIDHVFDSLAPKDQVNFVFQGGEPSLSGLAFYEFFTDRVKARAKDIQTGYAFQTNGLLMDDAWCDFFNKHGFLIGLSLDGDAALNNKNRPDAEGRGTFNRIMQTKALFDRRQTAYNMLCVLTAETARRAKTLWDFITKENIRYIQFIPCLEPLHETEKNPAALTNGRFYRFYSELFPLWKAAAEQGRYVSIRLFEDLMGMYINGRATTCGINGRCSPQIIVESDGSVYPCDFYALDEFRAGDLTKNTLKNVFEVMVQDAFFIPRELPGHCEGCAYSTWCQGGCKRMERAIYGELCGMKRFLDECLEPLLETARKHLPYKR